MCVTEDESLNQKLAKSYINPRTDRGLSQLNGCDAVFTHIVKNSQCAAKNCGNFPCGPVQVQNSKNCDPVRALSGHFS